MSTITTQMIAEIRALGWRCFGFGPEAWLAITAVCVLSAGIVVGMFLAALLGANGRDEYNAPMDLPGPTDEESKNDERYE